MTTQRKQRPDPVDVHVGRRIRFRRNLLRMTQTELGRAIGVSFKQVQKYESGANRIGAGRLYEIARALDVPVSYFFEGLTDTGQRPGPSLVEAALSSPESVELVQTYYRIPDPRLRKRFLNLIRSIASA